MIALNKDKKVGSINISFKSNGFLIAVNNAGTYGEDRCGEAVTTNFGDCLAEISKCQVHNEMIDEAARIKKEAEAKKPIGDDL